MTEFLLSLTRTALIVWLVINFIHPLYAVREAKTSVVQGRKERQTLPNTIIQNLESKGLDHQAAIDKTSAFLCGDIDLVAMKLNHLHTHDALALSEEAMIDALSKLALFGKPLDLNSYDAVVGFVQEIKGRRLSVSERYAIREIVSLNSRLG